MENRHLVRLLLFVSVFTTLQLNAQLSGTVSVPGTYASLSAALVDINTQGVNGPFTVFVSSAYTETVPVGGFSLTATGSVTAPISFIKSGVGSNPQMIAYTGGTATPASAVQDGIWRFVGSDYVTVDGIDLLDPNISNPATMEYGFGFFKANTANGCQNNTIQNCTISLSYLNNANGSGVSVEGARGINVVNALAISQISNITPISSSGSNSFNKFYGNKIVNTNIGIALIGYSAPSPFTLADIGNEVGGLLSATGNTIENFGGASAATNAAAGLRTLAQYNIIVANNRFQNNNGTGSNHVNVLRGIYLNTATSAISTIINNTITLHSAASTQVVAGIENLSGATASSNTITMTGNVLSNCSYTTGTSGIFYGIFNNAASAAGLLMSNNTINGLATQFTSGSVYLFYNSAPIAGAAVYTNNIVSNVTHTGTANGAYFGLWNNGGVSDVLNLSNNTFSNVSVQQVAGAFNPLYNTATASVSILMDNNLFTAIQYSALGSGTSAILYNNAASSPILSINSNSVINSVLQNSTGACHVVYNRGSLSNTFGNLSVQNNFLDNIAYSSLANGAFYSIWNNNVTTTLTAVSSNTIVNQNWQTTSSTRYLIANTGVAAFQGIQNNVLSNCSGTTGTTGQLVAIYNLNNSAVSSGTVAIESNLISNIMLTSTSADLIYIQNQGATNNIFGAVSIQNNSITACSNTVLANGACYSIYNNSASAQLTTVQNNQINNSAYNVTNGLVYGVYNRGVAGNLLASVVFSQNAVSNNSYTASSNASVQFFVNAGVATTSLNSLQVVTNTVLNTVVTGTSASLLFVNNTSPAQGSVSISNNSISAISHLSNLTGAIIGLQNAATITGSLVISGNTLNAVNSGASSGSRYNIYNSGAVSGLAEINLNLINNNSHAATGNGALVGIFNAGGNGASLSIVSNTLSSTIASLASGASYGIYHNSSNSNTISTMRIENNSITNYTATGTGAMYGIFKNAGNSFFSSLSSNTLSAIDFNGTNNTKLFVTNGGLVSGTLTINSNSVTAVNTPSVTGGLTALVHNSGSVDSLFIGNNQLSSWIAGATAGSLVSVVNAGSGGSGNSLVSIYSNSISGVNLNATGSAYFAMIQNGGVTTQKLELVSNSINNCTTTTTSGHHNVICLRGTSSNTLFAANVSDNLINNIVHSSTTGSLSGIFCNGYFVEQQTILSNSLSALSLVSSSAPRAFIYNTCTTSTLTAIRNNTLSQITGSFGVNITNAFVLNSGSAATGSLQIRANKIVSCSIASSTSGINLIHNTGSPFLNLDIDSNYIAQSTFTAGNLANILLVQNTSLAGDNIAISSNTIEALALQATGGNIQVISNTRTGTLTSIDVTISKNVIATNTVVVGSGQILGVYNHSVNALAAKISSNNFNTNLFSTTAGSITALYNSGRYNNKATIANNLLFANSFSVANGAMNGIANLQAGDTLEINGNLFSSNNCSGSSSPSEQYIKNSATTNSLLAIEQNTFGFNTRSAGFGGTQNYIVNSGNVLGDARINQNSFSSNQTAISAGSVALIENSGGYQGSLQINNNDLAYQFSASGSGFFGDFTGINCISSGSVNNLAVSQNTFSNVNFLAGGNGALNYINVSETPANLNVGLNIWSAISMNQSGSHVLIKTSSAQNSLSVINNSIVGGYQITGPGGGFAGYLSNNAISPQSIHFIDGNDFSAVTASVSGFGSFYGINSSDAAASKTLSNNKISNINYNSGGFLFGIKADNIGTASSNVVSQISANVVQNIVWNGPFYGVSVGPTVLTPSAVVISDNAVITASANSGVVDCFGISVVSGNSNAVIRRNRVAQLTELSGIGTCNGIYASTSANVRIENNLVAAINAASTSIAESVNGLKTEGSGQFEVYYNTIYLNGISTGTLSGSNSLNASETGTLDLQNNILVNLQIPSGNGVAAVFRRANQANGYSTTSNRNLFYAGIPSANRLLLAGPSWSYSLMTSLQTTVSPRELNSISEAPVFLSLSPLSAQFLHIDPAVGSLIESAGQNITGIVDDIDTQIRQGNVGYAGTGTAPDIGADEFETSLTPCSSANAGSISVAGGTLFCEGNSIYLNANGYSTDGGISYQWKVAPAASGPFTAAVGLSSANRPVLITNTLMPGTYFYQFDVSCSTNSLTASSSVYSFVVNSVPGATAAVSPSLVCSGSTVTLSCSSTSGANTAWAGPGGYTSTVAAPVIVTGGTVGTGDYTVRTTLAGCSSTAAVTVSVNLTPPPFALSPLNPSVCAGNSVNLMASLPISTPTLIAGSQALQNASGAYPAPYSAYYGGQKMQFIILATELSAAGFTIGTPIIDISFPVVALGNSWGTAIQDCQNFRLSLASTTLSSLTQFVSNLNTVFGPQSFTPSIGFSNTHTFIAPFVWDGLSNIIVETAFSNNLIGNGSMSVIHNIHNAGFAATQVFRADNASISAITSATAGNINVGFIRPDFKLNGQSVGTYNWSPPIFLNSTVNRTVVCTPTVNTVYTVSLVNASCQSSNTLQIDVFNTPTINVTSSSSSVCIGNTVMLTASGAPSFTWNNGVVSPTLAVSPQSGSGYSVTGGNGFCPNTTVGTNITILPPLSVTVAATPSVICVGQTVNLVATGAQSFTWSNSALTASTVVSPTATSVYSVVAETGAGCRTSKSVNVKVNNLPSIVVSSSASTVCPLQMVKVNGAGANQYTWQPGAQTGNQVNVFPSVSTTYTLFGKDLNGCTGSSTLQISVADCSGIREVERDRQILVFPNPAIDRLNLDLAGYGPVETVSLYTPEGKEVTRLNNQSGLLEIDISTLAKGMYWLYIFDGTNIHTTKIIKD